MGDIYADMRHQVVLRLQQRLEAEKELAFQAIDMLERSDALGARLSEIEVQLSIDALSATEERPLADAIDELLMLSNKPMTAQEVVVALYANGRRFDGKSTPQGAVSACLYANKRKMEWSMTGHPRRWFSRRQKNKARTHPAPATEGERKV